MNITAKGIAWIVIYALYMVGSYLASFFLGKKLGAVLTEEML